MLRDPLFLDQGDTICDLHLFSHKDSWQAGASLQGNTQHCHDRNPTMLSDDNIISCDGRNVRIISIIDKGKVM